jgi:putative PIN family toxin of toxin-antitoxin system
MRIVFDRNVFVSALVIPSGAAAQALFRVIQGQDRLFMSKEIIHGLLSVLSRKFSRDREALSRVAFTLSEAAEIVTPTETIHVLEDESDNRVIECALCAGANVVVTGDKGMLKLGAYGGMRIISVREYLDTIPSEVT